MKRLLVLAAAAARCVLGAATGDARTAPRLRRRRAERASAGPAGELGVGRHSVDQIALYDGLTPLGGNIRSKDLTRLQVRAVRRRGQARADDSSAAGLRIVRDRWGVPRPGEDAPTSSSVPAGSRPRTAASCSSCFVPRGRIAALDVPGIDAFSFALSVAAFSRARRQSSSSAARSGLLRATRDGRQLLADVRAFVAGINAYHAANRLPIEPWTLNDVAAMGALIGAVFGARRRDETRRAMFLDALRRTSATSGARSCSTTCVTATTRRRRRRSQRRSRGRTARAPGGERDRRRRQLRPRTEPARSRRWPAPDTS